MKPYRFWRDPLFILGCVAYAINRWLLKPHLHSEFLHSYFNDVWLIPCALPPLLWLEQRLGLRRHDDAPRFTEIALHLVFWSVLFEWLGPHLMAGKTGDPLDIIAYAAGAFVAGISWQRDSWVVRQAEYARVREGRGKRGVRLAARR